VRRGSIHALTLGLSAPLALLALGACSGQEEVEVRANGEGLKLVDVGGDRGWRRLCVMRLEDEAPCTSEVAQLIVRNLEDPGQFVAIWSATSPNTVEGVVFGGDVARCERPDADVPARLSIRHLPIEKMPPPDRWSPQTIIAHSRQESVACGEELS
jgi:hypothetical protein